MKTNAWHLFSNYSLSVIPLFLLMGNFATKAGMSESLFKCASAFLGHRKGGVAMAAIGGCAGFGAICGSSLATAATMGKVALPELRRLGYSPALSTGALAAGGTLGILIPPSSNPNYFRHSHRTKHRKAVSGSLCSRCNGSNWLHACGRNLCPN